MRHVIFAALLSCTSVPSMVAAQDPAPAAQTPERNSPDVRIDPLQPDFNLSALPTTLRMPGGKWAFRVTHRFNRNLGQGDFGDLAGDLFGLDGGGQIGLEVRIGLRDGTQVGIHRTSDRAIQLFGQHNLIDQRAGRRFGLDLVATFEGDDNLSENHKSALGVVLSKAVANRATVYLEPLAVLNANPFETGDDHTMMLGLGARVRMTRSMYLVGEYSARPAGYDPGADQITFGIESRTGGHLFQINFGNGLGTTFGQLAGGGVDYDQWFLGFNISRKFF
jgi:hypothetical protein